MRIVNNLTAVTIETIKKGQRLLSNVCENLSNRIRAIFAKSKYDPSRLPPPKPSNIKIAYQVNPEYSEAEKILLASQVKPNAVSQEIRAFNEILTTEQSFSGSLQKAVSLMEYFVDSSAIGLTKSEQGELEEIRDDYYQTLLMSKQLSRQFNFIANDKSLTFDQKVVKLGELYQSEDFKNYANSLEKAISQLETGKIYKAQTAFTKFPENGEEIIVDMKVNLNQATITPAQRFPRHEMLLENLLKSVDSSSDAAKSISNALDALKVLKKSFAKKVVAPVGKFQSICKKIFKF